MSNDKSKINKKVFKNNIIIRRDFIGKELNPQDAKVFQDIVNQRRPWSSSDCVPQTFIPDLSHISHIR